MDIDGLNIEFARKLHQSFKSEIEKNATVASVAILHNEQLAATVSWGVKDSRTLQPASIEDLYNIGSVSKLYCVAAIMKLVEMERLSLDDFVYEILPEFKMADERYKDITVKMLINHSSGLPGTNFRGAMNSKWLGDNYYEKCYEWFANCKLKAKPGQFSVYCNDGFTLAEMIVVRISGLSFGEFIQCYVSQPMGAYSTCTGERYSKGHTLVSYDGVHEMALVGGAGGISTCISDLVKFGNVFINPNGLLKDHSIRLMTSPQGRTFLKEDSFTRNFGLGWDSVDFEIPDYDLGEGTLLKEGSTFQFKTSLLVCKKYSVTAAISMIPKSPFNTTKALVEIVASYLELNNHNIKDRSVHCHKTLSTFPLNEDYSGIYLNADVTYKIYHSLNRLEVSHLQPSGFKPLAMLSYQYGTFTDGKEKHVYF
jgi:CubicO group peptidase (beta-lactamase class C family)